MSNPNGQSPYPNYSPPGGPQAGGEPPRPMYPQGGPPSPYPAVAAPHAPSTGAFAKRAPSRTLPIIVGVGVAVGVFGGLMIIRGTGNAGAEETPTDLVGENIENGENGENGSGDGDDNGDVGTAAVTGDGDEAVAGASDAGVEAGDDTVAIAEASIDAAPAAPEMREVSLVFDVTPASATVLVAGSPIEDGVYTVELEEGESREVKVEAKAKGYRNWSKTVALASDDDEKKIAVELDEIKTQPVRRNNNTRRNNTRRNNNNNTRRNSGSGGLIDL
ncbi:hypothetical protein [Haliangium ochraceum]|uniref:PEGA domain-containing protein n=1 Tax=Haliangium ochraceum (strain DSM 14365 / JCM 11303 / SMP-2) TaxID=502025 RepID=D0LWD1_HALO1|nr:hypothetical protein [Haliangium ochraceum]ACY16063.1 hypothetical protein Hoch_3561 [Haliangium ochraceum DSM 14365]